MARSADPQYLGRMLATLLAASLAPVLLQPEMVTQTARGFSFEAGLRERILAKHAPGDGGVIRLALPIVGAADGAGEVVVELRRFAAVSEDVRVELGAMKRVGSANLSALLCEVVHLEGTVVGAPQASCYLALGSTGVAGWIDLGAGRGQFTLRSTVGDDRGRHAGAVEFVRSSGTAAPEVPERNLI